MRGGKRQALSAEGWRDCARGISEMGEGRWRVAVEVLGGGFKLGLRGVLGKVEGNAIG